VNAITGTGTRVRIGLDAPPRVASLGVGVHGTASAGDEFRLPDLWQLHLHRYEGELTVDGEAHEIKPGRVSLVAPGALVRFHHRDRSEHLFAHFELPSDGERLTVPVMQDAGPQAPVLADLIQRAVAAAPHNSARAAAELWTVLWRIADLACPAAGGTTGPHPALAPAVAHIESHLAASLTVPEVAHAAGISHNQLIRLFQGEFGTTVVAHVRRRRMERARHLLRESTLSIQAIAAAVGIADLQAFNKACRRELGCSPRAIRARLGAT
jgi:AraC-like DNA-binding protein